MEVAGYSLHMVQIICVKIMLKYLYWVLHLECICPENIDKSHLLVVMCDAAEGPPPRVR